MVGRGAVGKGKEQEQGFWSVLIKGYGLLLSFSFIYIFHHAVST